ncbi:DUF2889 domain-containing protein [Motiliproteus sp.]|uniref:DUF2889 domain-containing protein n=1 Tax=Motiliproteus sp. TaxID=1898955 RepID=UPI003BAA47FF
MPLPPSQPRKHLHTRQVECHGYEREDGLFDIEGRMTDIKTYDIDNQDRGGQILAGEPIHNMSIRLTMDLDFTIHGVEAVIDDSPFNICPSIASRLKQLEGKQIKPGWNRMLKALFAGSQGCTHLTELLGPIATTAFQATGTARRKREGNSSRPAAAGRLINSCHALSQSSEVVQRFWPESYQPETGDSER